MGEMGPVPAAAAEEEVEEEEGGMKCWWWVWVWGVKSWGEKDWGVWKGVWKGEASREGQEGEEPYALVSASASSHSLAWLGGYSGALKYGSLRGGWEVVVLDGAAAAVVCVQLRRERRSAVARREAWPPFAPASCRCGSGCTWRFCEVLVRYRVVDLTPSRRAEGDRRHMKPLLVGSGTSTFSKAWESVSDGRVGAT